MLRIITGLGALLFATTANAPWEYHGPPTARPAFCANFKSKVFFMTNRASLFDQAARDIVSLLAKTIATCQPAKIVIAGFVDLYEKPSIARERAETVKRELMTRGVAPALLEVKAPGAVDLGHGRPVYGTGASR